MDDAKNGVIYFSLGSNVKSKNLPDYVRKALLRTLGKLNQTVIWKFEENLPDAPKNVHIVQWAPQQSILGNCLTANIITIIYFLSTKTKTTNNIMTGHTNAIKIAESSAQCVRKVFVIYVTSAESSF